MENNNINESPLKDSTKLLIGGFEIWVQWPAKDIQRAGTLLLLPGWNFTNTMWCDSTNVCAAALRSGLVVVAPQMGKSIYATEYFPETRADYRKYPTLTWLDSALNIMVKKQGLFTQTGNFRNFVLGLSTGARGAALLCAKKPGFFHAAALLSGDYNQAAVTDDALCTIVYGPYEQFPDRWKQIDNPSTQVDKITTPMYIGHGGMDKVVHVTQSIDFHDSLLSRRKNAIIQANAKFVVKKQKALQTNPEVNGLAVKLDPMDFLELNVAAPAGHDWDYWRSELPAIWSFFNKR